MILEELHALRKKVMENKNRLMILNNQYNEILTKKHSSKDNNHDGEIIKRSKAYKIMSILRIIVPLSFGTLFTFGMINIVVLFVFLMIYPFVGAIFEGLVLPKIVFGKDYKIIKSNDEKELTKEEIDELYERVSDARFEYHRLRKEFEEKINIISISDQELYQEYLNISGEYAALVNEVMNEEKRENQTLDASEENKMLNL